MDQIFSGLYIEEDKLAAFAANSAKLLEPDGEGSAAAAAGELRRQLAAIRRCHEAVRRRYESADSVPPACEWLLDNWYLAQQEAQAAIADLRRAKRQRLGEQGLLMLSLCRSLLSSGQGRVDAVRCREYLRGFQTVLPLRRRELLLFPAAMRSAILEAMAAVCDTLPFAADTTPQRDALEALFTSLRWLGGADTEELLRSVDLSDAALAEDPEGVYVRMDRESRQIYLERLEAMARAEGVEEQLLARRLVRQARDEGRHVGFYLFDEPSGAGAGFYIAALVLTSLFLSLLLAFAAGSAWAAPLLLLPVSELVKGVVDLALLRAIPARRLPRLDLTDGVPPEGKTLCVLSALLTDEQSAEKLCRRLEEFRLAHRKAGQNLQYGILADLPAADTAETEADAAVLRAAREAVLALNRRSGGGYYLFTRPRSFDGERWSGEERKRGALLELAKLLADEPSALSVTGERDALVGTRYILTLDSDTRIQPGAAFSLIGAMLHPLNRAVIDPEKHVVTAGYGLIHPRLCTELESANATDFALIFAGPGGSDPYGSLCGELYMNVFDCGGFAGKGILDLHALLTCTAERIPPRSVLSHDALEGAFLRGGYLGDAVFADRFPARPFSYYKRLHRWVRGDWQNSPWLGQRGRDLRPIDRWRLFDSLRRSLLAPMTLLAILAGFFLRFYGLRLSAWAALLALLGGLMSSLIDAARNPSPSPRLRRYARLLTGVGGAIVQSLMRLWLLPWEAWVCLSAAVTALWRMLVSHKKLLEWETAAQSEQNKSSLAALLRAMAVPAALGLVCLLASPAVIGRSAGLLWLLSPAVAAALALPAFRTESLSRTDWDWLKECAADTWRYFAEFCTAEEHFLPPDNVQHQPPKGPAHRTSPTNMGLAAAAAVAACDMEIISADEALAFLSRLIGGMERLPRCRGHFYNWYDTRTLQSLHPPFLSAVDSGNCWAGLRVAKCFACERGDGALSARIEALLEPMDFAPLYDPVRELFYISYDTARGCGAGGWYDLMASEAMLTSYVAIAKGDVPVRHWRRLGRGQLQKDGFRGLASWAGTAFEYLMPALFLPYERGSLLYESSRFCLYAQRRCVPPGQPWGISESAYFSLDADKNYRYKAHGCPALSLRRGQERDLVIAPYASFLLLAVSPQAAVQNLRRLERRGLLGRWGFKDALDLTPGRCRSASGEVVDCTMVHHAGMSLLAAANALCDGSIRRRFFSEADVSAHELLLQEQPGDGALLRRSDAAYEPRETRAEAGRWLRRGVAGEKGMCLLSNGAYHLLLDERGCSRALAEELLPYDGQPRLSLDGETLLPGPAEFWTFLEDGASWSLWKPSLSLTASAFVSAGELGECRALQLKSSRDRTVCVRLDFRPVLARRADWESHPSFWRLGLWSEARGGALLIRRLPRGEAPGCWLCLRASVPLLLSADESGGLGWLSRPYVTAEADITLSAGEKAELRFALCLAAGAEAAFEGAGRLLEAGETERGRMIGGSATLLGLSTAEIGRAMELLPALTSPRLHEAAPQRALWPHGISGDLPILTCRSDAREAEALLGRFLLLRSAGLEADLVYFSDETGEYRQPFRRSVVRLLARHGLEPLLGARSGVHILPLSAAETVESRAALCFDQERPLPPDLETPSLSAPRQPGTAPDFAWGERDFRFEASGALPPRPWQHLLTNGRLGFLAADCGSGFLWLENAREMPLTLPPALPEDPMGGEALWVEWEGRAVSLFAANDGFPCRVSYAPGLAIWDKRIGDHRVKTSAFIPRDTDARLLLIEGADELELFWAQRLAKPESVRCRWDGQLLRAENPDAWLPDRIYLAGASREAQTDCDFAPSAFRMRLRAAHMTVLGCGCCEAEELTALLKPAAALASLSLTASRWSELCSRAPVVSADPAAAHYLGVWAAYQVIACRLLGRSSLYQRGGAYGFRDQLQDAVNILPIDSGFYRERLVDAARHQYEEGDVMHWWHPHPSGDRGLRSRCSDDLLWLPWALCEWVDATGDGEFCFREEPYLSSPPLRDSERDRYEAPPLSETRASLLEHARLALDCCVSRGFGRHGLPLMGSGDWNDGLDRAGGESVWLGFFLAHVAARFARLLEALGQPGAEKWQKLAAKAGRAADAAFAGGHYLRGYWPDGTVLGGEERIDATVQSWAVLSGFGSPDKTASALSQALERLVDREHGLVRLFDPPYGPDEESPGYISSYGEGFRENGGQYTHGAVWLAMALHRLGRSDEAREMLRLLLPETHDSARYGAEPFVLPADVCAAPGREGEAGWTWYTGSAGWYLRAARELAARDGSDDTP